METGMLHLHSILRWIILVLLLVALFHAVAKKEVIKKSSLFLLIAAHTMFVIGVYQLIAGRFGITKGMPEGMWTDRFLQSDLPCKILYDGKDHDPGKSASMTVEKYISFESLLWSFER